MRGPQGPPSPPGLCLDLLQEAQQGRRRQAGGKQRHLIDVRRLARRAHGSRFVEVGHGLDRDASPLELAKRPLQGLGRAAPWPGRIGTKPYQDFPVAFDCASTLAFLCFLCSLRAALPEGCSFLASILLTIGLTMHFYPTERVALFIDGANLYATAKALGFDIDYKRLLALFRTKGQLVRALYYTALAEDQEYSSIRPLIDWLDYNGYTMVTKPTKEFTDATRPAQDQGQHGHRAGRRCHGAGRSISTTSCCSPATAISARWSRRCSSKGKRVSVVSTLQTQPPMVADELRRQADQFIDLADLQERDRPRSGRTRPRASRARASGREPAATSLDSGRTLIADLRRPTLGEPQCALAAQDARDDIARTRRDCPLCPRLVAFRATNRRAHPDWFNGAVPSFGPDERAAADRRASRRAEGRQPHRAALHRRLCRRAALRTLLKVGLRARALRRRAPDEASRSSTA